MNSALLHKHTLTQCQPRNVTPLSRWHWSFLKNRPVRVSALVNLSHPGRFKHTQWFENTQGYARRAELRRLSATESSLLVVVESKAKHWSRSGLLQWSSLCLDVYKSYVRWKNETQVSKNRYTLFGDAEEQPPNDQQGDAKTNAPFGRWKPASNKGKKLLFIAIIAPISSRIIVSFVL